MAVSGSANNQDPLQAYRLTARDAQVSGKFDSVIRGKEESGAIKTGKMSWKEWFISWLPAALVRGDGASSGASAAFEAALESCLKQEGKMISSASKEYLASGKPLTARKVIEILVAEGLGKDAKLVDQNIKNWDAFKTWFSKASGKKLPAHLEGSLRLAITSDSRAYERDLTSAEFVKLAGASVQNALAKVYEKKATAVRQGINPEALLGASNKEALNEGIADLEGLRADAVLLKGYLSELSDAMEDEDKNKQFVDRDLADVNGYIKQIDVLLNPSSLKEAGGTFECTSFSAEVAERLSEDFTGALQAGGARYLDVQGEESDEGFLRAEGNAGGFGLDINRATVSINGDEYPAGNFEATAGALLSTFTQSVEEGGLGAEGKAYLRELSNVLGQGMIPTAIAAALEDAGFSSELIARPSDILKFDIRIEGGKVKVSVECEQKVHNATMKEGGDVAYPVSIDESESKRSVVLDFTFDPKPENKSTITVDGAGCSYSHNLKAQGHPEF